MTKNNPARKLKTIRSWIVVLVVFGLLASGALSEHSTQTNTSVGTVGGMSSTYSGELALQALGQLTIKGRAPKSGYSREEFGSGWATLANCDMRNAILARTLRRVELASDGCSVEYGILQDPYTGMEIVFDRKSNSDAVHIDHVVSLSDAWQKGAQAMDFDERVVFANDPLNLLAVDGRANRQKGDADASSWLPQNRNFRCRFIARQIAVKQSYRLWVTEAEETKMRQVLKICPDQRLPVVEYE